MEKRQTHKKHHLQESQAVSHFPAGDQKATRNRQDSMTEKHKTQITKKDPQKKHRLGTVVLNCPRHAGGRHKMSLALI